MISVVVPAYNEEKTLSRCLKSLQKQQYAGRYEIIVVDNASTDATAKVAAAHGVKIVFCSKKGVAYARQAGADAASGDIVAQADADTTYPPDWLDRISSHFSLSPASVALAGSYIYEDPQPWWAKVEYRLRYLANRLNPLFFGNYPFISGANFAFRRESFKKAGGYSDKSLYPDQWGIAHRLSKTGRVYYLPTLRVVTSSRRVQKPIFVILFEGMQNFAGTVQHLAGYLLFKGKGQLLKFTRARATRISLPAVIVAGVLVYGYAAPSSQIFGKVYYQVKATDKVVALTIDDGPNELYTSQILKILDDYGIKATFFVVGKNVALYPDTAKEIIADGNVIANHSYNHNANHALTTYGSKDIDLAQAAISETLGITPTLYRPPHGKKSPWELHAVSHDQMVEVTWSVAGNDQHLFGYFGRPTAELLAKEIVKKTKPGKIILLHDGYALDHSKEDEELTVNTLPLVIQALQAQDYEFVTVPELLDKQAYN